jgi:hypothetical protein
MIATNASAAVVALPTTNAVAATSFRNRSIFVPFVRWDIVSWDATRRDLRAAKAFGHRRL